MTGDCKLCGKNGPLVLSHLTPRFVVKWLKKTSATGYLRNLTSGKRQQESKRVYLLCASCEQLLGKDEKKFAECIFVPYQQRPQPTSFQYEEWLLRFLVGLHWRAIVTQEPVPPHVRDVFATAEERWRKYLLGQVPDPGVTEFHLQFLDVVEHTIFDLPKKINWYLARSFDASPIYTPTGNDALSYVKFPRLIMLAFISPRVEKDEDWNGTQVTTQGTIDVKQKVYTTRFGEFLLERAKELDDVPPSLTERQKEKMLKQAETNPRSFLDSDSYQVHLADRNMTVGETGHRVFFRIKGRGRNKPCPCGSGIKAKKCHAAH